MEIRLRAVGVVRTFATEDQVREHAEHVGGQVEIYPEYEQALEGIEGYSHLFLICYLHKLRAGEISTLKAKPRGLLKEGFKLEELPLLGVFAVGSPARPNPIGLTLVQLIKREGRRLFVRGLDYFDGTPILDIKGYRQQYRVENYRLPGWYRKLTDQKGPLLPSACSRLKVWKE